MRDRDAVLAALSAIVYLDWSEAALRCAEIGVELAGIESHRDAEAMHVYAGGGRWAAIVFRGTEFTSFHLRDIANNLGWPRPWAGPGRAHSGYAAQLERIRDRAAEFFDDTENDVPLYVAGHSLGGALGGLFAAWATGTQRGRIAGLTTFGAPKAASAEAWSWLRRPGSGPGVGPRIAVYRIRGDFAPYWPPSLMLTQPAESTVLDSPDRWIGPVRRHDVDRYATAMARRAADLAMR